MENREYNKLKILARLYNIVNDKVFRITEPKSSIFSTLHGMTSDNKA